MNSGRSQRYICIISRPAPLLHLFCIFDHPGQFHLYISSISRPAPPLHSFYIFDTSRPVPALHEEYWSACLTSSFILYFWHTLASPCFTWVVSVSLHHLCGYFYFSELPAGPSFTSGVLVSLATFAFILYFWQIPASPSFTWGILVGLPHLCIYFILLTPPCRSLLHMNSISRPAPPLRFISIFENSRLVPALH